MLITRRIVEKVIKNVRFYSSSSVDFKKDKLLIQKTTYPTDDWTNINSRFEPFVGANLYQRQNHPLRLTHEEIVAFFRKWFGENVDSELKIYKNLDPIESNNSTTKNPAAFYVNRDLVLRTDSINREINYLKSGAENFLMILDLYRRCEMDSMHFPVLHRVNVFRTINNEKLHQSNRKGEQQLEMTQYLEEEHKTALVELVKHLMGTDVKYRWNETIRTSMEPSWTFELWHYDEWHQISGSGLIRRDILEKSERLNTSGWEIAIGLDHLAMILYNIFDIRLLWNADQSFLKQFEAPRVNKTPAQMNDAKSNVEKRLEKGKIQPNPQTQQTFTRKANKYEMDISYILPSDVDLESFPIDALCRYIKNSTENAAERVKLHHLFIF